MVIIPPNVNRDKLRKPAKASHASLYRDHPHTTRNGVGVVGALRKKKARRK